MKTERSIPPVLRFVLIAGVAIVLAHLLDPWAQEALRNPELQGDDLGRLFRVIGYYPLWLLMAIALYLHERPSGKGASDPPAPGCDLPSVVARRRAGLLILTPGVGGIVAELAKIIFRRLRPGEIPGEYVFRSVAERPFYSGGLGLPSSHTLVAFAGAAMLARLFPRAAPIWYLLAAGCGFSRVAAGAHYLSDVVVAGVLGWVVARVLWRWNFGAGLGEVPASATDASTTS